MRTNRLTLLAGLSLALLIPLLCGYFTMFGPACHWFTPRNATTATVHFAEVKLDRGGFRIQTGSMPANFAGPAPTHLFFDPFFDRESLGLPPARPALWQFVAGSTSPTSGFILAFPLWCPVLPCLIAPIQWLRRSGGTRDPHGFPVEPRGEPPASPAGPGERDSVKL